MRWAGFSARAPIVFQLKEVLHGPIEITPVIGNYLSAELRKGLGTPPCGRVSLAGTGKCFAQDARDRDGQIVPAKFIFARPGEFCGVASCGKRPAAELA